VCVCVCVCVVCRASRPSSPRRTECQTRATANPLCQAHSAVVRTLGVVEHFVGELRAHIRLVHTTHTHTTTLGSKHNSGLCCRHGSHVGWGWALAVGLAWKLKKKGAASSMFAPMTVSQSVAVSECELCGASEREKGREPLLCPSLRFILSLTSLSLDLTVAAALCTSPQQRT
jgi:hypothetical protein